MAVTGHNILSRLNEVVTGDVFLREVELPLFSAVRVAADGSVITAATAPTAVVHGISLDDGETAWLHFDIPMDYDAGQDICALRLHEVPSANAAHTTDLGITTSQSISRAGAAIDATVSTAVAEAATASTGQLVRENILNISGRSYQPGDHVRLLLDANNSGATELILLGVDLIYSGDVAAYNDDDRFRY